MGGKSSKEAAPQGSSSGLPGDASEETTESGVVLAIDLQKKILDDFQSKVLKEEWEKRQKYLLAKNSKRRLADFEFQQALKDRMEAVRRQQTAVHANLDEKVNVLQARFSDVSMELQDDTARFEKENLSTQPKAGASQPCLDVRTKLADCYQGNRGNSSYCDAFVDELTMCIERGVEMRNEARRAALS